LRWPLRQTDQDTLTVCRSKDIAQSGSQRMAFRGKNLPTGVTSLVNALVIVWLAVSASALRQIRFDQLDSETLEPEVHAGRLECSSMGCRGWAGAFQRLQSRRHFTDTSVRKLCGLDQGWQPKLPACFGNQLADGDRIEVQIAEHPMLVQNRRRWKLCAFRHQL